MDTLTERARALLFASPGYPGCVSERIVERMAAFAQSEREAAAAEARTLLVCAVSALSYCVGWINTADEGAAAYPEKELRRIQAALASPAPQDSRDAQ